MSMLEYLKKGLINGKKMNIVFVGDSITSTEWIHPNWREIIEYVLKEELAVSIRDWKIPSWGIRCFNCGFDGSTTKDTLEFMDEKILSLNPNIAIFLANSNDVHFDEDYKRYKKDVENIINRLSEKCDFVIITNFPPGNNAAYNKKYAPFAKTLVKIKSNKKTIFIDLFSKFSKYDLNKFFTFKSMGNPYLGLKPGDIDFVHPNQLGNAYIAKIILENAFSIKFNPEKYIATTLSGEMYPKY